VFKFKTHKYFNSPKNYKGLLNDKDFLLFSEASIEDKIAKLKKEIKEERNEYKRNKLKSKLVKLKKDLKTLQKHLSFIIESEKSKSVSQRPVNQRKEQVRGLPVGRHKNWQVLFTAFAFCYLEKSYRGFFSFKTCYNFKGLDSNGKQVSSCTWCRDYKYATVYDTSKIPPVGVGSV
jgi:hypothetical protein